MSAINRENYEIYIIDYLDGMLSPAKHAAFKDFIEANPDIRQKISFISDAPELQVSGGIVFNGKNKLKKNIDQAVVTPGNAETFLIAEMEGDISASAGKQLSMLKEKDEAVRKLAAVYQKTRLNPGKEVFTGKNKLKRKANKTRKLYLPLAWTAAVAASVMLLVWLFPTDPGSQNAEIAQSGTHTEAGTSNTLADVEPGTNLSERAPDKNQVKPEQQKNLPSTEGKATKMDRQQLQSSPQQTEPAEKEPSKMPVIRINNIKIAQVSSPPVSGANPEIPSTGMYQKAYASSYRRHEMSQTILGNLYSNLNLDQRKIPEVNAWDIAQAGVKGFNVLTENNMALDREIDEKGRVTALAIKSENLTFVAPLRFRD